MRFCLGEKGGKEGNFVIRVMLKDLHGVLPGCGDSGDSGVFIIKRRGGDELLKDLHILCWRLGCELDANWMPFGYMTSEGKYRFDSVSRKVLLLVGPFLCGL